MREKKKKKSEHKDAQNERPSGSTHSWVVEAGGRTNKKQRMLGSDSRVNRLQAPGKLFRFGGRTAQVGATAQDNSSVTKTKRKR